MPRSLAHLTKFDRANIEERVVHSHTIGQLEEQEIAATEDLTIACVHRILKKHKERLETYHAAIGTALTKTQLGSLAEQRDQLFKQLPKAVAELTKLLESHNQRVKLDAITRLLDRVGMTPNAVERLLEASGIGGSAPQPSEKSISALLIAVQQLSAPVEPAQLPPIPPALRLLQTENTAQAEKVVKCSTEKPEASELQPSLQPKQA